MPRKLLFFSKNLKKRWDMMVESDAYFGSRMASLFLSQSFSPNTDYWVGCHGAMMRYFGTLYLIGSPEASEEFLPIILRNPLWVGIEGAHSILQPIIEKAGLSQVHHAPCMLHDGKTFIDTHPFVIKKSENLRLFFDFLTQCHEGFGKTSYPLWYQDYAARLACQTTELYFLYEQDRAVACATLNVQNHSYGVLGSVSTLPAYRGKGYGRIISAFITNRICEKGLTAALQCHDEGLVSFYTPLGYQVTGEWASAERNDLSIET